MTQLCTPPDQPAPPLEEELQEFAPLPNLSALWDFASPPPSTSFHVIHLRLALNFLGRKQILTQGGATIIWDSAMVLSDIGLAAPKIRARWALCSIEDAFCRATGRENAGAVQWLSGEETVRWFDPATGVPLFCEIPAGRRFSRDPLGVIWSNMLHDHEISRWLKAVRREFVGPLSSVEIVYRTRGGRWATLDMLGPSGEVR
jgi:hypothetical protein